MPSALCDVLFFFFLHVCQFKQDAGCDFMMLDVDQAVKVHRNRGFEVKK